MSEELRSGAQGVTLCLQCNDVNVSGEPRSKSFKGRCDVCGKTDRCVVVQTHKHWAEFKPRDCTCTFAGWQHDTACKTLTRVQAERQKALQAHTEAMAADMQLTEVTELVELSVSMHVMSECGEGGEFQAPILKSNKLTKAQIIEYFRSQCRMLEAILDMVLSHRDRRLRNKVRIDGGAVDVDEEK